MRRLGVRENFLGRLGGGGVAWMGVINKKIFATWYKIRGLIAQKLNKKIQTLLKLYKININLITTNSIVTIEIYLNLLN